MRTRNSWSVTASRFATNTVNPIRAFVEDANLNPNPNKALISLSIGDPTVFGNLKPCEEIMESVESSLRSMKHHGYIPSVGTMEAREAVSEYSSVQGVQVEAKDVILTCGCSHALEMCITVLANSGQNILIPRPGFPIYQTLAEGLGIRVKYYNLVPERNWEVDLDNLEANIDSQTAAIVVNNPSNPCGSVFSKSHLQSILQIASRNFVPIIADEIYEHFVFPGKSFHSLASLSLDVPILSCSGLTKRFLVPGWRTGWIIIHDRTNVFGENIRRGLQALSQKIMGGNALIQGALPRILKTTPESFFQSTLQTVKAAADLAYAMIFKVPGLKPVYPEGAMYMMVGIEMSRFPEFRNDVDFVKALFSEESVFCMPGKCFHYPNYFRIVLTIPAEMMQEACERLAAFCKDHYASENGLPKPASRIILEEDHTEIHMEARG